MKYRILLITAIAILLIGVAGSLILLNLPQTNTVQIRQDGKVVRTVNLAAAQNEEFTLRGHGGENTIEIRDGHIRVKAADCPDKTCVHMGWLHNTAAPIVCLPHHLEISFTKPDGGADAVAG